MRVKLLCSVSFSVAAESGNTYYYIQTLTHALPVAPDLFSEIVLSFGKYSSFLSYQALKDINIALCPAS